MNSLLLRCWRSKSRRASQQVVALEDLKVRIGAQRLLLAELADPIKAAVNSCVSQVEGVDCFDYPEQSFGDIKALLASFL